MKKYSFLEHTADIRLKLEASTLEELFESALEGMASLMFKTSTPSMVSDLQSRSYRTIKESLTLSAADPTALLVDFLSEVLTVSHIDKAVFDKVTLKKLTDQELEATIHGIAVDAFEEDIKAVTYHEAYVKKNNAETYEGLIIFDI